jgi:hypothetical protein
LAFFFSFLVFSYQSFPFFRFFCYSGSFLILYLPFFKIILAHPFLFLVNFSGKFEEPLLLSPITRHDCNHDSYNALSFSYI